MKIGTHIHTGIRINHTGYDVTDYFRFAVIEVKNTVENAASDGFAGLLYVS